MLKQAVFEFWESKPKPQYFQQSKNRLLLQSSSRQPDFQETFQETFTFGLSPSIKDVTYNSILIKNVYRVKN